ncbi:MAG: NUDIX hydrolase [Acidimicrobiaceae bacterium]|nr:CoA pyrophosphatase [Ilumatobacteraceae bacterium]
MSPRRGGAQVIPRPDTWRLGEPPQWLTSVSSSRLTREHVEQRIGAYVAAEQPSLGGVNDEWLASARASAVLVPLIETPRGLSVVLTRRADHLRNHRGEISFPGGRVEESESLIEAALREATEEVALPVENVSVIGQLDPHATFVSNSLIVPVVGMVNGSPNLTAQASEVARILVVPLTELAHPDSYRNEWWATPRGDLNIHFFYLHDETIWGATGRILRQLFDVLFT